MFILDQKKLKEDSVTCHQCGMCFAYQASLKCTWQFTLETSRSSALNVENISEWTVILRFIWEYTLERGLLTAQNVKRVLQWAVPSIDTWVHTGEKPFICLQCGKSFAVKRALRDTWELTLEKSLSTALNVERVLQWNEALRDTWELTLEKSLSTALNVERVLQRNKALRGMREYTLERNLSPAPSVERVSQWNITLIFTWEVTIHRNWEFTCCQKKKLIFTWEFTLEPFDNVGISTVTCVQHSSKWSDSSHSVPENPPATRE